MIKKILFTLNEIEEFEKRLLEKLNEMKSSSNYLIRNTILILAKVTIKINFIF